MNEIKLKKNTFIVMLYLYRDPGVYSNQMQNVEKDLFSSYNVFMFNCLHSKSPIIYSKLMSITTTISQFAGILIFFQLLLNSIINTKL